MRRDILNSKFFIYKGKNIKGETIQGKVKGLNKTVLFEELSSQGIFVEKIARDYQIIKSRKIKMELLLNFIEEWYNLEITRLTTQECLEIIRTNTFNKKFKLILGDILNNTNSGKSLQDSFAEYNNYFPDVFLNQIINGLICGNVIKTLKLLKDYYKEQLIYYNKIKNSLVYPKVLGIILIGVLFLVCRFIVPSFYDFFKDDQISLSKFNQIALKFLIYLGENYFLFLFGFIILFLLLKLFFNMSNVRKKVDVIKFIMFKKYNKLYMTTMVSNTLYLYWSIGMNKIEALLLIKNIIKNKYYQKRFNIVINQIKSGMNLGDAFNQTNCFDRTFTKMLKLGESNNCILDNLYNASLYYQNKLNIYIDKLIKLIEPIVILFLSILVLVIILIIFIPILNGFKVVI